MRYLKPAGDLAPDTSRFAIARRLRLLREAHGLTQREIARDTGISVTSWNNYERGRQRITVANMLKLKLAYNVTYDWVLWGHTEGLTDATRKTLRPVNGTRREPSA